MGMVSPNFLEFTMDFDRVIFLLALAGSVWTLYERVVLRAIVIVRAMMQEAAEEQKKRAAAKEARTPSAPKEPELKTGSDDLKTMIALLSAQGEQLTQMNASLSQANQRITSLESAKTRASRRKVAPEVEPQGSPVPGMDSAYESLPPVSGGFEQVR